MFVTENCSFFSQQKWKNTTYTDSRTWYSQACSFCI